MDTKQSKAKCPHNRDSCINFNWGNEFWFLWDQNKRQNNEICSFCRGYRGFPALLFESKYEKATTRNTRTKSTTQLAQWANCRFEVLKGTASLKWANTGCQHLLELVHGSLQSCMGQHDCLFSFFLTKELECWNHCNLVQWLEHSNYNLEVPSSVPNPSASWICFQLSPRLNSLVTLVNSHLVCLWPPRNS